MSKSRVKIPSEISKVDALEGLWNCSQPARFFRTIPNGDVVRKLQEEEAWKSREEVKNNIQNHPNINFFGGRCIKTDFSKFPDLDLSLYTTECQNEVPVQEILERCFKKS